MSGYQQRWRNVYTNGSFLQGDAAVGARQMTVNFYCQVSSRRPRSVLGRWYSPHAVRSCCWGGSSVQHIPLNWHAAYAWVLEQETALLLKMLPPSHRSYLGQQGRLALFHLLCSITGESGILNGIFFLFVPLTVHRSFVKEPTVSRIMQKSQRTSRQDQPPPRASSVNNLKFQV